MMNENDDWGTKLQDGRIKVRHPDEVALWPLFDFYRGQERLEFTVLLIVALYRDQYITKATTSEKLTLKEIITNEKEGEYGIFFDQYLKLLALEDPNSSLLKLIVSHEAFEVLSKVDKAHLQKTYPIIFNDVIGASIGKHNRELTTPIEIVGFMSIIGDVKRGGSVYNPFAGPASFSTALPDDTKYFGQEFNHETWQLGFLRNLGNASWRADFRLEDSASQWPKNRDFDLIISCPPFGRRLPKNLSLNSSLQNCQQLVIQEGIDQLNENGRLVVLVTQNFLFGGHADQRIREILIEEDLLESVISLPSGAILGTGVLTSIIVIKKNKTKPGIIQLVDASPYFPNEKGVINRLIYKYLLKDLATGVENENIQFITTDEISKDDYIISPKRFSKETFVGTKISTFVKPLKNPLISLPVGARLLNIYNLRSEDDILFGLKLEELNTPADYKPRVREVSQSCLLIALSGDKLKPTSFSYEGTPIYLSRNVAAFTIDSEVSFPDYMVHALRNSSVQRQADIFRTAVTIASLKEADFLKIKIELPSPEKQHAKIQSLYEVAEKFAALNAERQAIVTDAEVKRFDDFASLKHTIGHARENILGWADNLHFFFLEKYANTEALNTEFADFYKQNVNVLDALTQIKRDITFISDLLESEEEGLVLANYPTSLISIADIKNSLITAKKGNYQFETILNATSEEVNSRGAKINLELFKILVVNILVNADIHGFKEDFEGMKKVEINLQAIDGKLILTIRNNGAPLPKNYRKAQYSTLFATSNKEKGSGIGGYDVNRIANYFGANDWQLISNPQDHFPVTFIFEFPLEQI